ncbi:MAG: hypothetical protein O7E57_14940 [Gammaproteobacteria bacterium]|nr:hypothetical protein [Gammaproteobacteria bacterium]MCZ6853998.1 hypothetical protein [Gammaproteobacteria bacterium]
MKPTFVFLCCTAFFAACTNTPVADHCTGNFPSDLSAAIDNAEGRLANGCEYHFDRYFISLLDVAEANPSPKNKSMFSDHLINVNEMGIISQRQARELYNRYFNIKFVSFTGDYNTCAQTCPVQDHVISNMKSELQDKQLGLLRVSSDKSGYYRADHLLKEAQLVLEATCRACASNDR